MICGFHNTEIDGIKISWIDRDDGKKRIHSIIDSEREGAFRITDKGFFEMIENDETGPLPEGLIVFGNTMHDRFKISEVLEEYPEYKEIMQKLKNKIKASDRPSG